MSNKIIIANGTDKKYKLKSCSNLPKFSFEIPKFVNVYKKRLLNSIFFRAQKEG